MKSIDKAIKAADVGRGYDQSMREAKGLLNKAKALTTQYNRMMAEIKELSNSIKSDSSFKAGEEYKVMQVLNEARSYFDNHTEIH